MIRARLYIFLLVTVVAVAYLVNFDQPVSVIKLGGLQYQDTLENVVANLGNPIKRIAHPNGVGEYLIYDSDDYDPVGLPKAPFVWLDEHELLVKYLPLHQEVTLDGTSICKLGDELTTLIATIGRPSVSRDYGHSDFYGKTLPNPKKRRYSYFDQHGLGVHTLDGRIDRLALLSREEFQKKWW